MEGVQFEPMSVGRIIDRTFTIYRNNFLRFVTIVAIIQVPVTLLSLVSSSFLLAGVPAHQQVAPEFSDDTTTSFETENETRPRVMREDFASPSLAIVGCLGTVLSGLLAMVGAMLCQAALTKSVSETYLGRELSVGQAYKAILPRFLSLLGASFLVGLVVWLGFLLLIVPGVIFALWLFLTTPSIVVENHRAIQGMSRSKALISGNLGKALAVAFVAGLIGFAINMPTSYLGVLIATLLGPDNIVLSTAVSRCIGVVGQILATPIGAAASILLYYDLRIRKEGFDLQMLAQSAGYDRG